MLTFVLLVLSQICPFRGASAASSASWVVVKGSPKMLTLGSVASILCLRIASLNFTAWGEPGRSPSGCWKWVERRKPGGWFAETSQTLKPSEIILSSRQQSQVCNCLPLNWADGRCAFPSPHRKPKSGQNELNHLLLYKPKLSKTHLKHPKTCSKYVVEPSTGWSCTHVRKMFVWSCLRKTLACSIMKRANSLQAICCLTSTRPTQSLKESRISFFQSHPYSKCTFWWRYCESDSVPLRSSMFATFGISQA